MNIILASYLLLFFVLSSHLDLLCLSDHLHCCDQSMQPQIVKHLDEYVIGQEKAKKILAVAVYNHYSRVNENLRQTQIQESLTAIANSPGYYAPSVLMSDGPSTPDPIIDHYTGSNAGSDSANPGTKDSNNSSNSTTSTSASEMVPGRRKSNDLLSFGFVPLNYSPGRSLGLHHVKTLFMATPPENRPMANPEEPVSYARPILFSYSCRSNPLSSPTAMDQLGLQWQLPKPSLHVLAAIRHIPETTITITTSTQERRHSASTTIHYF